METEQAAASTLTNEDKLFPNVRWCGVGNLAAICYGNLQAKDSKVSLYSISNCGVGRRNAARYTGFNCVSLRLQLQIIKREVILLSSTTVLAQSLRCKQYIHMYVCSCCSTLCPDNDVGKYRITQREPFQYVNRLTQRTHSLNALCKFATSLSSFSQKVKCVNYSVNITTPTFAVFFCIIRILYIQFLGWSIPL